MVLRCMKIDEREITLATMRHGVDNERSSGLARARPRPIAIIDSSLGNKHRLHKEENSCTIIDLKIPVYIRGGATCHDNQASLIHNVYKTKKTVSYTISHR